MGSKSTVSESENKFKPSSQPQILVKIDDQEEKVVQLKLQVRRLSPSKLTADSHLDAVKSSHRSRSTIDATRAPPLNLVEADKLPSKQKKQKSQLEALENFLKEQRSFINLT